MDDMQIYLDILRDNDVDVDTAEELNLASIREALAQQDAEGFHFYLHGLKGFAGNLGINEISDAAQAALIEFRATQFRNTAKLEGLLEEIEALGEKFASALVEIQEIEEAREEGEPTA